jgi:hypothetical protein
MAKKTAVASAVAAVVASAPVAEPVKLFGDDLLASVMSPEQCTALADFAGLVLTHDMARDTFTAEADAIVRAVWSAPAPYDVWKPAIRCMREASEYAAKCLRDAYKRVHGALPTAGDARATGGTKGASPRKWAAGFASSVDALVERIGTMPRKDLNPARVRAIVAAVKQLEALIAAERSELAA